MVHLGGRKTSGAVVVTEFLRLVVDVPAPVMAVIDSIAAERGITRTGLVRQALGVIKTMHEASKEGLHTGVVRNRNKLDSVLIAPL